MTTRDPEAPRLLTGAQRTALAQQLDVLRETAERAERPGTAAMANRWASLLQRAPTIDAAYVTDFGDAADRCRLCVEQALADRETEGPAVVAEVDRRRIGQLIDTLRLHPLFPVPVPGEPSAYLAATEYTQLVHEVETTVARALASEVSRVPSGIPECLAAVARSLAAATDGTAMRVAATVAARAWAMGRVVEMVAAPETSSPVAVMLDGAIGRMYLDAHTVGAARVHPEVSSRHGGHPRDASGLVTDAPIDRLLDELTLALQHVGPRGLEAAVSAGQRHSTGFAESTDATQRVMMRAALQAYLETSGLRGMVARLADTVRRLPVAIPLEGPAVEAPDVPSLVSSA